jgi:hypothetical protein
MKKDIVFLLKRVILVCSPLILLLALLLTLYVYLDPFKVIKKYQSYYISDAVPGVILDRDYVSTSTFNNNYPLYKYNSFIFGNSRSIFYEVKDWEAYIAKESSCFHFDASGESLYGIYKKIKYLDRKSVPIHNALVIFDHLTLIKVEPEEPHLLAISPQLENNKNLISFHLCFIKAFFTPQFMIAYLDYKISNEVKDYMKKNLLLDDRHTHYELVSNEPSFPFAEELIEKGEYYTPERMEVFFHRDSIQVFEDPVIGEKQKSMLTQMNDIFIKNNTNFKIIINPIYDQRKINEKDYLYLVSLFGQERVFDFSGINEFTNDYSNYYEENHYRPHIAKEILKRIYSPK